jgi:hypothetical protein
VAILELKVALKRRPWEDGLSALIANFEKIHLKPVCEVTFIGEAHAVEPIFTDDGIDAAPKLIPETVTVPPSSDREDEKENTAGES